MQKDLGPVMGLYPTPVTIVGTVVDGRATFLTIAHVGVVEHHRFIISVDKVHSFSDSGIQENGYVSVSLVSPDMLEAADWCGITKGAKTDKSVAFAHHFFDDVPTAPIIDVAPVSMVCEIVGSFEVGNFTNYICNPLHTFVQEECISDKGKIDYEAASPVLFEFQNSQYLSTGKVIGRCWNVGRDFAPRA